MCVPACRRGVDAVAASAKRRCRRKSGVAVSWSVTETAARGAGGGGGAFGVRRPPGDAQWSDNVVEMLQVCLTKLTASNSMGWWIRNVFWVCSVLRGAEEVTAECIRVPE